MLESEQAAMQARHALERDNLETRHRGERRILRARHDAEGKRVQNERGGRRTAGLVAILARVSGFNAIRRQFDKHRDKRREKRFDRRFARARRTAGAGAAGIAAPARGAKPRHGPPAPRASRRWKRANSSRSKPSSCKEQRVKTRARGGGNRMPALNLDLKPPGRRDAAIKAKNRHGGRAALDEAVKTPPEAPKKTLSMREDFTRAAGDSGAGGSGGATAGSSDGHKPTDPTKPDGPRRKRRRDRDRDNDLER